MRTNYHTDQRPAYECSRRADRQSTPTCRSIAAATVDDAVADRLLAALNPHEVALALAAADAVTDRHHRLGRAAELAVERARYEATAPNARSTPSSPRTVWWQEHWKDGGAWRVRAAPTMALGGFLDGHEVVVVRHHAVRSILANALGRRTPTPRRASALSRTSSRRRHVAAWATTTRTEASRVLSPIADSASLVAVGGKNTGVILSELAPLDPQ
jgi:hypothetical protein